MTTDKGLKKAIKDQPAYRLPSNFTYRMMRQVREEAFQRERKEEHRLRWVLAACCALALGVLFYTIKEYGAFFTEAFQTLCQIFPSGETFRFFLPTSVSLACLVVLYWWLDKKIWFIRMKK